MTAQDIRHLLASKDMLQTGCFINGQWVSVSEGKRFNVVNPATGKVIATVPRMGYSETLQAIEQAHAAWEPWKHSLAAKRARALLRWAQELRRNIDDIAILMTQEMGKPISQSRGEVKYAAQFIEWYAAEARRTFGATIPETQSGRREIVWKEPVGVAAAITPWNFPAAMIARKVAPAIAAGCPAIVKPAEASPLTALAMAKCAELAGMPAGIFNVITGKASEIGKAMTESRTVRKLSFTGSTKVGKLLYAQCADTVKKLSLELGGNAPFIVFEDADLKAAIRGLDIAKFRNSGQTCVCANRVFVHEKIYDKFRDRLMKLVSGIKVRDPMDEAADIGCLVSGEAFDGVKALVDGAVAAGATLLSGGGAAEGFGKPFFAPTVLENITHDMPICQEEIFGPVVTLIKFRDEAEVLRLANDTPYGLASYFYTKNYQRIFRMSEGLEYGMVGVNLGHISSIASPFGGYKESGIGREASTYGIEEFLETKYVAIGGLNQ